MFQLWRVLEGATLALALLATGCATPLPRAVMSCAEGDVGLGAVQDADLNDGQGGDGFAAGHGLHLSLNSWS